MFNDAICSHSFLEQKRKSVPLGHWSAIIGQNRVLSKVRIILSTLFVVSVKSNVPNAHHNVTVVLLFSSSSHRHKKLNCVLRQIFNFLFLVGTIHWVKYALWHWNTNALPHHLSAKSQCQSIRNIFLCIYSKCVRPVWSSLYHKDIRPHMHAHKYWTPVVIVILLAATKFRQNRNEVSIP